MHDLHSFSKHFKQFIAQYFTLHCTETFLSFFVSYVHIKAGWHLYEAKSLHSATVTVLAVLKGL